MVLSASFVAVYWPEASCFAGRYLDQAAEFLKMRNIEIITEPVELYKLLKFEGMVASGGEAKAVIADGQVSVNGKTETRKRKKVVAGDSVEFMGETIRILLARPGE